ncbi:related to Tripeptidyl-peptidase sed3 [Rhynchosporium agropyri]|uniref:tripeptidyl-peptidase II n=1 Tax=Rhynchosporium agropyri TaxID=914238 RepID=A0A1E1LT72_9HELO|nr:related to Tripeptidyl-peptidase sed3 [Rhynchosporium agropyri]
MKFSIVTLFIGTAAASLGSSRIFEQLDSAPEPWLLKDDTRANQDMSFKLRIHLKNRNLDELKKRIIKSSTPDDPSYGGHLSREEVNSMIAPSGDAFVRVRDWLESYNLSSQATFENDWVLVDSTIGEIETLLDTKYHVFENTETGRKTARTLAYSLPAALHAYVDIVAPTIVFGGNTKPELSTFVKETETPKNLKALRSTGSSQNSACNGTNTIDCLKTLYKFKNFRPSRHNGNEIAVAHFVEQYFRYSDLATFYSKYAPDAAVAFKEVLINGGLNPQNTTIDNLTAANMDTQLVGGLTYPTPSTYFSTGGRAPVRNGEQAENEPFLEFLTYLLAMEKIPQTISIGYADKEWTVPPSYAHTVCDLFAQVTARGVTILFPSGDSGSGRNCSVINPNKLSYTPLFPASCPWVTTVGGTQAVGPEEASFTSGGGFSNYFPRPSWQDAAVSSWLSTKADPAFTQYYNTSGRAYPDVSAQGVKVPGIYLGEELINGGGGAATATFASVVALLNSDRISNGLPPFGFLNPWLYSVGKSGLNDILSGTSGGCKEIPGSGFTAVAGWDPITGLGTPDFEKLRLASTGLSS